MNRLAPLALLGLLLFSVACKEDAHAHETEDTGPIPPVKIIDTVEGTGEPAEEADLLILEYVGTFPDSEYVFDGNIDKNPDTGEGIKPPITIVLGKSPLIQGWHEGLVGVKKGGERQLEIPWQKAYGVNGNPPSIPPKQNLNFTIKVLDMVKYGEEGFFDSEELESGTGRQLQNGDKATIHYVGSYVNGLRFDSSYERGGVEAGGTPVTFKVGTDKVIRGIDVGIVGMRVGGKRRLRVPPMLAYGSTGFSVIMGDQVLMFDIELIAID